MSPEERDRAIKLLCSGLMAMTNGTGGVGGIILMAIHGGQHVYAIFGAGEDLDLIPLQVIAEEAGMTVLANCADSASLELQETTRGGSAFSGSC
jgi:hypothetical protein